MPTEQTVQGNFHLSDPWWKVSILRSRAVRNVRKPNDRFSLTYELRKDEFVPENGIIFQFLTRLCGGNATDADPAGRFVDFVR